MNKNTVTENKKRHILILYLLMFLSIVSYTHPSYCEVPTFIIPYGSILPSLTFDTDIHVIFLEGIGQDTHINGSITLLGHTSFLDISNAQIYGTIMIDTLGGHASLIAHSSYIQDSINLYGDTTHLHLKQGCVVRDNIIIIANKESHTILEDIVLISDLSIGLNGDINILEVIDTLIQNSNLYLDAKLNKVHISGNSWITPTSTISIYGSSEVTIASPLERLDFLKYDPTTQHHLILTKGYEQTAGLDIIIPLPNTTNNILTLSGSKIIGDIIINPYVDVHVLWKHKTYFIGGIYTDTLKQNQIGAGLDGYHVHPMFVPSYLPDMFILGLQNNSLWEGDIIGDKLQLGIIESTVAGNITITASETFISHSTILGDITSVDTSTLILDNVHIKGQEIQADIVYIEDTVSYAHDKNTQSPVYSFQTNTLYIGSNVQSVFSTHNKTVGEKLQVFIPHLEGYSDTTVFFEGDVDFTSMTADTFILTSGSKQTTYLVNYKAYTMELYTDSRRIENVLQGFKVEPRLFRNTMSGYDVTLEQNALIPDNYDIILLGYSVSNDAFAGAFLGESLHTSALERLISSQLIQHLGILSSPTKPKSGVSLWSQFSFYHSERTQKYYSNVNTQLMTGAIGITSSPITVFHLFTSLIDFLVQFGYSHSKIKDIPLYNSSASTFSLLGEVISTSHITLMTNHAWFFSLSFGGGSYTTDITRPYSATFDKWNSYSINASFYTGYIATIKNITMSPYIGIGYRYTSEIKLISEDNTQVQRSPNNMISPSVGFLIDYTQQGIRPYLDISFTFPFDISKSPMTVAGVEREYIHYRYYTDVRLGLEYTHRLRYAQVSILGEVAMTTILSHKPEYSPSVSFQIQLSF